jgi:hypothetical protein
MSRRDVIARQALRGNAKLTSIFRNTSAICFQRKKDEKLFVIQLHSIPYTPPEIAFSQDSGIFTPTEGKWPMITMLMV